MSTQARWFLLGVLVLFIGFGWVLFRQNDNFSEHQTLSENTCAVVRNNVDVIRLFVQTENNAHDREDDSLGQQLIAAVAKAERLADRLDCP